MHVIPFGTQIYVNTSKYEVIVGRKPNGTEESHHSKQTFPVSPFLCCGLLQVLGPCDLQDGVLTRWWLVIRMLGKCTLHLESFGLLKNVQGLGICCFVANEHFASRQVINKLQSR